MPKPYEDWPVLMSRRDARECTGLSERQVARLWHNPHLPIINPEYARYQRVHKAELDRLLRKGGNQ